jgi:hypothetical protein
MKRLDDSKRLRSILKHNLTTREYSLLSPKLNPEATMRVLVRIAIMRDAKGCVLDRLYDTTKAIAKEFNLYHPYYDRLPVHVKNGTHPVINNNYTLWDKVKKSFDMFVYCVKRDC